MTEDQDPDERPTTATEVAQALIEVEKELRNPPVILADETQRRRTRQQRQPRIGGHPQHLLPIALVYQRSTGSAR